MPGIFNVRPSMTDVIDVRTRLCKQGTHDPAIMTLSSLLLPSSQKSIDKDLDALFTAHVSFHTLTQRSASPRPLFISPRNCFNPQHHLRKKEKFPKMTRLARSVQSAPNRLLSHLPKVLVILRDQTKLLSPEPRRAADWIEKERQNKMSRMTMRIIPNSKRDTTSMLLPTTISRSTSR